MTESPEISLLGKIAAYTEILAKDPRSTIFVSLSEAYRKMGMLSEAREIAEKGLAALSDYCPGHVVLARIRCQQGDLAASAASFSRALEIDPQNLAALVGFARVYLIQERMADARKLLLTARELSPADPVINKLLLGLPAEPVQPVVPIAPVVSVAEGEEIAAVDEAPEPVETVTLAELYVNQGLAHKALVIYRNLLGRDPDNLELRRRIRDLEVSSLPGEKVEATASPADPGAAEMGPSEEGTVVSEVEEPAMPESGESSILEQLNRLLTSIQKRRGDVQGRA